MVYCHGRSLGSTTSIREDKAQAKEHSCSGYTMLQGSTQDAASEAQAGLDSSWCQTKQMQVSLNDITFHRYNNEIQEAVKTPMGHPVLFTIIVIVIIIFLKQSYHYHNFINYHHQHYQHHNNHNNHRPQPCYLSMSLLLPIVKRACLENDDSNKHGIVTCLPSQGQHILNLLKPKKKIIQ